MKFVRQKTITLIFNPPVPNERASCAAGVPDLIGFALRNLKSFLWQY